MGLLDSFTGTLASPDGQMTPAAQGLLAAGLGILAHNRGLTSGTQALGMGGLEGVNAYAGAKQAQMQQQLQNAQLQQMGFGLQKNKMLLDMAQQYLGGGQPQTPAPNPTADIGGAPDGAAAGGAPAPMGGAAPSMMGAPSMGGSPSMGGAPAPMQAAPQGGGAVPGSPFGNMPRGLVAYGLMTDPTKLFENAAAQYAPTDIQKQLIAAGYNPGSPEYKAALDGVIKKAGYISPVSLRPGGFSQAADGTITALPSAAPEGYQNISDGKGGWRVQQVPGGPEAVAGYNRAKAGGSAGYQLTDVYDPNANGGKGGMVRQTVSNVADAASGNLPAPLRNNNPGAMMPGGKLAQYPDMQAGLTAVDNNLQSYGKQGVNTIAGVISKWAPPNENDTQAYIKDVSQRLGIPPNQKIDLSNPLHRQALSTAIALHENGPSGVFGSQQVAPQGPMAAAAPMGAQANANASQKAGADSMTASYGRLQAARASGQQALEAIDKMQQLAAQKSPLLTAGPLGTDLTAVNPSAAEYQKQRANLITMLASQNGTNGTDAGRALTGDAVPDYGKPRSAIADGLGTQANQVRLNLLKSNLLTPYFNSGDSAKYNAIENQFDQTIKPSMMSSIAPILQLSGDQQRAAVQSAVKSNPSLRPALEILFNNGMLK